MRESRTSAVAVKLVAFFAGWFLLQFLIGPIAYLNSKIKIPYPLSEVMEKTFFLPTWLAANNSHFDHARKSYVRWWVPASEEGRCGLELLPADAVIETEPWLNKQQNTTNNAMDTKGSVTER